MHFCAYYSPIQLNSDTILCRPCGLPLRPSACLLLVLLVPLLLLLLTSSLMMLLSWPQVPVELDQVPNDFQTFDRSSFTTKATDLSLVQVPHDCAARCPLTSICSVLQSRQAFTFT